MDHLVDFPRASHNGKREAYGRTDLLFREERWRSEGIQVGGVQSGRGVIGFWFDK